MRKIGYDEYLDHVHGCWAGKCVSGAIGAPYEGMKELLSLEFNPAMIENMPPNDDLDLQVLWLAVLEERGVAFTSDDLARAFAERCPYSPGEYAIFKKNHARGLRPPLTGSWNNRYYVEGMGCPIRSEIWGCIAPGNPALAAELAARDGVMDHCGNSVYAEQFLAALEAEAFFDNDLDRLVDVGLSVIPADSQFARLVRDVRGWCAAGRDWKYVRGQVIRHYGHPDCTNMYQNMGITLLALYLGGGDLIETTMMACNCGFDTDCTCSTAGAILGAMVGARKLYEKHGFKDLDYKLGVNLTRRSDRVTDLAEDTCAMGLHFCEHLNRTVRITGGPTPPVIVPAPPSAVTLEVEYDGAPAVGIGESRKVRLCLQNTTGAPIEAKATLRLPELWQADVSAWSLHMQAGAAVALDVTVSVPANVPVIHETNICELNIEPAGGAAIRHTFGIVGAAAWSVFGPFWQNSADMSAWTPDKSYYACIAGRNDDEYADNVRTYHLNTRVDPDREYMTLEELVNPQANGDAAHAPQLVNTYEDRFSVNDLVGFQGPCAVYAVRRLVSPEDRKVGLHIGHTDAFRLWVNGVLVSERSDTDWWTAENAHVHNVELKKGENTLVVKLVRRGARADFSIIFAHGGACSLHYADFASANAPAR